MRIDQKYFVPFMIAVGALAAAVIVYSTFSYRESQEQAFRDKVVQSDSLKYRKLSKIFSDDTLTIDMYTGNYVLFDFWASWSDLSGSSHRHLQSFGSRMSDTVSIIAASVKDDLDHIRDYQQKHNYSFSYVDGTELYNQLNVPGVPSQLLFNPEGEVIAVFIGYNDSTRYDSLRSLINDE